MVPYIISAFGYDGIALDDLVGVEIAKRLLTREHPAAGLTTIWESDRLDLSVEAKVFLPEIAGLFSVEQRAVAKARLQAFGYKQSDCSRFV